MGKKRGYAPEELQRAIDLVAENRKDKPITASDLRASRIERKAADKESQRRLFAVLLAGLAIGCFFYAVIQMGWVRFGNPPALEAALASPETAKVLHLEAQRLSTVPSEVGTLVSLNSLYLDGNRLDALPLEVAQLKELRILSLSYNQLSNLSSSLGALSQLQTLSLKKNRFQSLPTFVTGLTRLEVLDVSNNVLTALPSDLGQLSKLRTLKLGGNSIGELPDSFARLEWLEELDISGNPVAALPSPSNFPKLKILNIKGTKVDDETAAAFKKTHPKVRLLR